MKANPATRAGFRTPILLVIPRLVWALSGGQTRFRPLRHFYNLVLDAAFFECDMKCIGDTQIDNRRLIESRNDQWPCRDRTRPAT